MREIISGLCAALFLLPSSSVSAAELELSKYCNEQPVAPEFVERCDAMRNEFRLLEEMDETLKIFEQINEELEGLRDATDEMNEATERMNRALEEKREQLRGRTPQEEMIYPQRP